MADTPDNEALLIKPARKTRKPRTVAAAGSKPAKSAKPRVKTAAKAAAKPAAEQTKARFAKALDEARAGAQAFGKDMQARGDAYREQISAKQSDLMNEAKALTEQARERATALASDGRARATAMANDGKTRASDALTGLGKIVADNAGVIDDRLGSKYGDYARTASRQIQETAAKIDAKELGELGEDAREFVRTSPGLAIGLAAVAGFMIARLFRSSDD